MNKEQIMNMSAGREMDALVAEHVFGWRKVHGPRTDYDGACDSFDVLVPPAIDDPFPLFPPKGAIQAWWFCKNWSTDISAAMEVFGKFHDIALRKWVDPDDNDWFTCNIGNYYSTEKTAEEAICKCALMALLTLMEG